MFHQFRKKLPNALVWLKNNKDFFKMFCEKAVVAIKEQMNIFHLEFKPVNENYKLAMWEWRKGHKDTNSANTSFLGHKSRKELLY